MKSNKTPHGLSRSSGVYIDAWSKMKSLARSRGMSESQATTLARLHPWYGSVSEKQALKACDDFLKRKPIKHPRHSRGRNRRINLSSVAGQARKIFLPTDQ